jgi:hypothetical protein
MITNYAGWWRGYVTNLQGFERQQLDIERIGVGISGREHQELAVA